MMMTMRQIADEDGQYEFRDSSRSLIIRGGHPEWVLQAAAEVIGNYARLETESLVEELTVMHRMGAANLTELTGIRALQRRRFDLSPRCSVSLGTVDYIWASSEAPGLRPDVVAPKPLKLGPEMLVTQVAVIRDTVPA
jgi:hypothetical protein